MMPMTLFRKSLLLTLPLLLTACNEPAPTTAPDAPQAEMAPTSTASLTNTYWKLVAVSDLSELPDSFRREPHLVLAEDLTVKGHGGCNALSGSYEREDDALRFTGIASTRMACPDIGAVEGAFHAALRHTGSYRIVGSQLFLETESGETLATLEAVALP